MILKENDKVMLIACSNELPISYSKYIKEITKIIDEEIWVRGSSVMMGYYKMPKETEEALVDGWLKTGDLGYIDEEGFLFHKGRKDDLIIKGGINIYPTEIENVLNEIPQVKEALVIGKRDKLYGNVIVAYIVIKGKKELNRNDINSYLLTKLEAIKCPDEIVFVNKLEQTSTGKIKRKI